MNDIVLAYGIALAFIILASASAGGFLVIVCWLKFLIVQYLRKLKGG